MIENGVKLLLTCLFQVSAEAALPPHDIEHKIVSNSKLELQYIVDEGGENATMIGNLGAVEVTPLWNKGILSMIEIPPMGAPNTISIDMRGGRPLPAVYSRHSHLVGGFVPSQWYGSCTVK